MALALEDIGWGTAEHWMRMQASYELAQARRNRAVVERRAGALQACPSVVPALPDRELSRMPPVIRFLTTAGCDTPRTTRGAA